MAFLTTWTTITSAQTDADSPLDVTLMESIRQDLIHLYEWIGQGYTPSTAHNHDGLNSVSVVLADGIVNSSKLATDAVTNVKISNAAVTSNKIANSAITSTLIGATAVELGHLKITVGSYNSSVIETVYIDIAQYSHLPSLNRTGGAGTASFICQSDSAPNATVRRIQITNSGDSFPTIYRWDYHSS